jgi:adenylylsulfate kinase
MVYNTLVYIAKLLTQNGVNVLIDSTGNLRSYRDNARVQISRFIEVYLECPFEVCVQRETERKQTYHAPKGIYAGALKSRASTVPGVGQPYEEPLHPEIKVKNFESPPEQVAERILKFILAYKK